MAYLKFWKKKKKGFCLAGGLNHTPYRWIWDNRLPVPRTPSFSSQNSPDSSYRTPKVPWDWTFFGKSGHGWSILGLILPFSEPLLTLDTSYPILSLSLHWDSHLLLPQIWSHTAQLVVSNCTLVKQKNSTYLEQKVLTK